MNFDFKITGLEEVLAKMQFIKTRMMEADLSIALFAGAAIVRDAAIQNARRVDDPRTVEDISKNIALRVRKNKKSGDILARVGVRGGARSGRKEPTNAPGGDTRHWRHIEFGTSKTPARPFMRPALENNAQRATTAIVASLRDTVERLSK